VRAYVLPLTGGTPKKIADDAAGGGFSPDSNSVVVSPNDFALGIYIVDLQTGQSSSVPGSTGRGAAFWPSENMIVAKQPDGLGTFDMKTKKWTDLVKGSMVHWMQSVDGKYMYYTFVRDDNPRVMRVRLSDRKEEIVASLKNLPPSADDEFGSWLGVAPDGSPLLTRDIGTQEIYSLNVHWP
jgi:hypothetical protein